MATFNPFNPDGTWNYSFEFVFEHSDESFRDWWRDTYGSRSRGKTQLTEELARALILSNLDKFDVHYAEYWQRQRRMQMNEAKSKIGQLSIVHVPTVAEQFMQKLMNSGGNSDKDRAYRINREVHLPNSNVPMEGFMKLLMSPLFQWNS